MNDVKLLGRLTADPETRYTAAGDPVSRFCLAVNAGKDANGNNTAEFFQYCDIQEPGRIYNQVPHQRQTDRDQRTPPQQQMDQGRPEPRQHRGHC